MKQLLGVAAACVMFLTGAMALVWPVSHQGLVLYSAVDYGAAVGAAFTRETGVPITVIPVSTGALIAKVSAEGRHASWSLIWFDGDEAMSNLDRAGLLAPGLTPNLPWTDLGSHLLPKNGAWTPTGITLAGVYSYSRGLHLVPSSWDDLLSPQLNWAVGINNPAISGPMFPLLAGVLASHGGWPSGKSFLLALQARGLHTYSKNDNTLAALKSGDIAVAITQSSAALKAEVRDPSRLVGVPDPAFVLPSVIAASALLSDSERRIARDFIRFTLRPDIQALRMRCGGADGFFWPIIEGVENPNPIMPPLSGMRLEILDPVYWGAREQEVNTWFASAVVGE